MQEAKKLPSRASLILYKGLLRRARLFDRHPILKAYCTDPLKNTLYIPTFSFSQVIREAFRWPEKKFTLSRGFTLYKEWNDVYISVSKKIPWFDHHCYESNATLILTSSTTDSEGAVPDSMEVAKDSVKVSKVQHIERIVPGAILISHPAAFEKNIGNEVVLVLQRNERETIGLALQGVPLAVPARQKKRKASALSMEDVSSIINKLNTAAGEGDLDEAYSDSEITAFVTIETQPGDAGSVMGDEDDSESVTRAGDDDTSDTETVTATATVTVLQPLLDEDQEESIAEGDEILQIDVDDEEEEDYAAEGLTTGTLSIRKVSDSPTEPSLTAPDPESKTEESTAKLSDSTALSASTENTNEEPKSSAVSTPLSIPSPTSSTSESKPQSTLSTTASSSTSATTSDSNVEEFKKTIYRGGPRFPQQYVVLFANPNALDVQGHRLTDDLSFLLLDGFENLKVCEVLSLPTSQFRVFQGYQLFNTSLIEKEVQLGSYIVAYSPTPLLHSMLSINAMDHDNEAAKSPADNTEKGADQITLDEPVTRTTEDMWSGILSSMGGEFVSFAYSRRPMSPSHNKALQASALE